MCAILYLFLIVCNKSHANPTFIYENIKEIDILAVGGNLEFPILSHVLLRRGGKCDQPRRWLDCAVFFFSFYFFFSRLFLKRKFFLFFFRLTINKDGLITRVFVHQFTCNEN